MNDLIITTLKPLNIPVAFQKYQGKADSYITFFCYNEQGEAFADDKEIATGFYMQIDIWSKEIYTELEIKVKKLLKEAGFIKRPGGQDMYENETKIYHKPLRFFYCIESKEE